MKTLKLLILVGVAMIFASCKPEPPERPLCGLVETSYDLWLSFRDAAGNDLIKGIGIKSEYYSGDADLVDPEEYSLVSDPDKKELWPYEGSFMQGMGLVPEKPFSPTYTDLVLASPDAFAVWDEDRVRAEYRSSKLIYEWVAKEYTEDEWVQHEYDNWKENHDAMDGRYQFVVQLCSAPWYDKYLDTITYTLTCPYVFGDDAKHEIVTYWRKPTSGAGFYRVCYRVECDGKEFSDISCTNYEQSSFATITLDRP